MIFLQFFLLAVVSVPLRGFDGLKALVMKFNLKGLLTAVSVPLRGFDGLKDCFAHADLLTNHRFSPLAGI